MIFAKKKESKFPRVINFYCSDIFGTTIFVPCNFSGGISSEIEAAVVVPNENKEELGQAFIDSLANVTSEKVDVSNKGELKDWPAYQASKLKSGKEFERKYTRYNVQAVNEANLFYRITSPKLPNKVELSLLINAHEIPLQIGIEILKIHSFYIKCRENT